MWIKVRAVQCHPQTEIRQVLFILLTNQSQKHNLHRGADTQHATLPAAACPHGAEEEVEHRQPALTSDSDSQERPGTGERLNLGEDWWLQRRRRDAPVLAQIHRFFFSDKHTLACSLS